MDLLPEKEWDYTGRSFLYLTSSLPESMFEGVPRFGGEAEEAYMNLEQLRKFCMSFPGVKEQIQWEDDLLFKVGGKMFAITPLEPARFWLTLKADPEEFAELTERPGVVPAPYLARAKWVAIETAEALTQSEVEGLLRKSYELVVEKLPTRVRKSLSEGSAVRKAGKAKSSKRKKRR